MCPEAVIAPLSNAAVLVKLLLMVGRHLKRSGYSQFEDRGRTKARGFQTIHGWCFSLEFQKYRTKAWFRGVEIKDSGSILPKVEIDVF
jgi:hypothetical protein